MLKFVLLLSLVALATCGLLGGYERVDVEDEEVLVAANHAAEGLSKQFASKFHHRLAKVLKAERQVVAGTNFRMDVIVGMTNCEKEKVDFSQTDDCDFKEGISTYKKCTVVVFKDLNDNHKLISTGCILASKKDL